MTDINTVNKGIQYLKSHENLDEIKIEINDPSTSQTVKSNKIRSQSILNKDQISSSTMLLKQQQTKQLKQRKIYSPKQIKINGGRELGIVTIVTSERNGRNKIKDLMPKPKKLHEMTSFPQKHVAAAAKHIKNHQSLNQLDLKFE